jgi:hypothetical protein
MTDQNSKETKKGPAESFSDMIKEFGSSVAEIFNDPTLKEKAKDFGDSASASAKAFAARFKDEEVKTKFKSFGHAAKTFGDSVANYFKDEKKKETPSDSTADIPEEESSGKSSDGGSDKKEEPSDDGDDPNKPKNTGSNVTSENTNVVNQPGHPFFEREKDTRSRNSRITGYSFAIAWNIIFFIFFNFFNQYIASYSFNEITDSWTIVPFITSSFYLWLPVLNAAIIASIVGNVILIINDSFYFDNVTNIFMDFFGLASAASLLILFPFDFSVFTTAGSFVTNIVPVIIRVVLIVIIAGLSVGIIVRFIKVIVKSIGTKTV